ncbi:hypothetical protein [Rhodococcus sp. NPDC003348]
MREPLVDLDVLKVRGVYLTTLGAGLAYGTTGLFTILLPKLVMTPAVLGLDCGFGVSPEGFAMFQASLSAMIVHSRCLAASSRWKFRRRCREDRRRCPRIRDRGWLPDEKQTRTNDTVNRIMFKGTLTRAISKRPRRTMADQLPRTDPTA